MLDHLSIQCADVVASASFYDATLAPLGGCRILEYGPVIGYGVLPFPDFWLAPLENGDGFRASHIAFSALNRESVRAFFAAAVGAGTEVLHEPRVWAEYHENRGVHFGAVGLVDMPDRPWSGASHCIEMETPTRELLWRVRP